MLREDSQDIRGADIILREQIEQVYLVILEGEEENSAGNSFS